jgi:hypothetical protein
MQAGGSFIDSMISRFENGPKDTPETAPRRELAFGRAAFAPRGRFSACHQIDTVLNMDSSLIDSVYGRYMATDTTTKSLKLV